MTTHAQPRKAGRIPASASIILTGIGLVSGLLTIADHLRPTPPPTVPCLTTVTIVERMSDVDGLEEFGGLARWRDVLLRYPGGRTEPYRMVAMDGHLPGEFKRPLNESRTAYETFTLASQGVDGAVYDWRDIEER
jgi:hypothetical protein